MKISQSILVAMLVLGAAISAFALDGAGSIPKLNRTIYNTLADTTDAESILVYATFIVDEKGEIGDIKVKKFKCRACDKDFKESIKQSIINVISEVDSFKPALKNGKPIKIKYTIPIRINLVDGALEETIEIKQ